MHQLICYELSSEDECDGGAVKRSKMASEIANPILSSSSMKPSSSKLDSQESIGLDQDVDFFHLNDTSSDSSSEGSDQKLDLVKRYEPEMPTSGFWSSALNSLVVDEWSSPSEIWKTKDQSTKEDKATTQNTGGGSGCNGVALERTRGSCLNVKSTSARLDTKLPDNKIEKSPLFVHHRVKPCLYSDDRVFSFPRNCSKELNCDTGVVNKVQWCVSQYSHLLATAASDRIVKIWNCLDSNIKCVQNLLHHCKAVRDISWSSCGQCILSCGYDKHVFLTQIETGQKLADGKHEDFVTSVKFHPVDSNYFVTGSKNLLNCWDKRDTSKPCKCFRYKDKFGQVQDVVFNTDGTQMFSCNDLVSRDSADRNIMAWDFRQGVVISNQIYQERFTCTQLKVHPHAAEFYAQSQGGYVAVFSTIRPYKMNKFKRFEGHKVAGYSIGFDINPSCQYLASGSADGKVAVYDIHRAKVIRHLDMGRGTVCIDVAWHPVLPSTLAVCTWDGRLAIWQ